MATLDIFLKLDGIDGEITAKGHEKEIAVLSYEQALDVTVIQHGGGGSTVAKPQFFGIRLRKNVDLASIPMMLSCASGRQIASARFTFRRGGAFEFYKVTLEDVLITHMAQRAGTGAQYPLSFDALASGAASDGFIDEATLAFTRIRWEYRAQKPNGSPGATRSGGWDVKKNKPL